MSASIPHPSENTLSVLSSSELQADTKLHNLFSLRGKTIAFMGALFALSWLGLHVGSRGMGCPMAVSQSLLLALAVVCACSCFHVVIGIRYLVAVPLAVCYLAHPLCIGDACLSVRGACILIAAPLLLMLTPVVVKSRPHWPRLLLGLGVGVIAYLSTPMALLLGIAAVTMSIFSDRGTTGRVLFTNSMWPVTKRLLLVAVTAAAVTISLRSFLGEGSLQSAGEVAGSTNVSWVLTAVDRDGIISGALKAVPAEVTAGGGRGYWGLVLLILTFIGLWPGACEMPLRRVAIVALVAFAAYWWLQADKSLHEQLVRLFEFVTVRRHVAVPAQHLVGFAAGLMLAWAMCLGIAAVRTTRLQSRASLGVILVAVLVVLVWFCTSPTEIGLPAASAENAVALNVLTAFGLIVAAGGGVERLMRRCRRQRGRIVLTAAVFVLLFVDAHPYIHNALQLHNAGGEASAAETHDPCTDNQEDITSSVTPVE